MPARSTGCFQCRKRKIRCDEKRPGCDRCRVHGVVCGGYRQPAVGSGEVVWRDETGDVVSRVGGGGGEKKKKSRGMKVGDGDEAMMGIMRFERGGQDGVVVVEEEEEKKKENGMDSLGSGWEGSIGEDLDDLRSFDLEIENWDVDLSSNSSQSPSVELALVSQRTPDQGGPFDIDFHMARAHALCAGPTFLASPAMEKAMIYSTFMDTYLPKRIGQPDAHFSVLERLITTPDLRSEVCDAVDALSLVQVGSVYKDQDLLRQSVKMYSKSLNGLLKTLNRNDAGLLHDDYLLATVTILATCEFFDEIAQTGEGWSKHTQGSQELLLRRGPNGLQTELGLMLYLNMRHGALSHALIGRQATFLGSDQWRANAFRAPIVDHNTILYDLALQVPTVLERYDRLDDGSLHYGKELEETLAKALELSEGLQLWFEDVQKELKFSHQGTWRLVDVTTFDTFCQLVENRHVDKAFLFPNFMLAYSISAYWNVMHFLRTTIKKMHMAKHDLDKHWFPEPEESVAEEELFEYVKNLARCFPYFCEPSSSSSGQIGMFLPLRTVAVYCVEHSHWSLLKWVGSVRDKVFIKGLRPPSVKERRPKGDPRSKVVARPTDSVPQLRIAAGQKVSFSNMVEV